MVRYVVIIISLGLKERLLWLTKRQKFHPLTQPRVPTKRNQEILGLKKQLAEMRQAWASGMPPPSFLINDLENTFNYLPLSQAQFPISIDTPQHALGFNPINIILSLIVYDFHILNRGLPPIQHHLLSLFCVSIPS